MSKNRSLGTTKLICEIFYIFLHSFERQSGHGFVTYDTGQINMSLRNTIQKGIRGKGRSSENDCLYICDASYPKS